MAALSLALWQWIVILFAWILFFLLPAVWMARRAARDGDRVFTWTVLVLVGSFLGILEYFHHRSILRRRAKRAARAQRADDEN